MTHNSTNRAFPVYTHKENKNGCGVPREKLKHVFNINKTDIFTTTKKCFGSHAPPERSDHSELSVTQRLPPIYISSLSGYDYMTATITFSFSTIASGVVTPPGNSLLMHGLNPLNPCSLLCGHLPHTWELHVSCECHHEIINKGQCIQHYYHYYYY